MYKLTHYPICKQIPATSDNDSKAIFFTLTSKWSKGVPARPETFLGWPRTS